IAASTRISKEFDCVCVVIEPVSYLDVCAQCCKSPNVIVLKKNLTQDDYRRLSECEHFDVILVPDPKKIFGSMGDKFLPLLLNFGDHNFIDMGIENQLRIVSKPRTYLLAKAWDANSVSIGTYCIKADFDSKYFIHHLRHEPSVWLPGI